MAYCSPSTLPRASAPPSGTALQEVCDKAEKTLSQAPPLLSKHGHGVMMRTTPPTQRMQDGEAATALLIAALPLGPPFILPCMAVAAVAKTSKYNTVYNSKHCSLFATVRSERILSDAPPKKELRLGNKDQRSHPSSAEDETLPRSRRTPTQTEL